ncbi:MAG TPA: glucosamine-6-phosphate deaminase [Solirubrobacteraceae bacterium]|nr:glucosamine-6-phosphate deaminase [Solirubrobacteraceae bacterium]
MEVVICESPAHGARLVADAIAELVAGRPNAVLGLATGGTPEPVYEELARRHAAGAIDFSQVSAFLLDEYLGLPSSDPAAYRQVIERQVVAPLGIAPHRVHGLDGTTDDPPRACAAYEAAIAGHGGVDLQLLGIGTDGHIGFNEPGSSLGSRTRIKTLTDQTRADNARFFGGDADAVPRHVLTQGIGTIREARHLLLLAWGQSKADAIAACVEGPVAAAVPATALQLHPHATVIVDPDSAAGLARRAEYERTFSLKPAWQGL